MEEAYPCPEQRRLIWLANEIPAPTTIALTNRLSLPARPTFSRVPVKKAVDG
jgi:hypothetical protein